MKRKNVILILITPLFMLFINSNYCLAEDLLWSEDKAEVFEMAKEQEKLIFLFVGRETCNNCKGTKALLNEEPLRAIVEGDYIAWYSNHDDVDRKPEVRIYTENILSYAQANPGIVTLPLLYIINPNEPEKYIVSEWGYSKTNAPEILMGLLVEHTTSNDIVHASEQKVFMSGNTLNIYNNIPDEHIYVYSIEGKLISSFHKKDNSATFDASRFPKGILIINSSKRWSRKIVNL